MSDAPELEALRNFSEETDRDSGRFFVGREAELGLVSKASGKWAQSVKAGVAPFGVVLISGAPGAGKTALLQHLLENPPESAVALAIDLSRLSSEAELVGALVAGLAGPLGVGKGALRPSGATANLGVARITWDWPSPPETFGALERAKSLRQELPPAILLIDEVQSATPDQARMLAALHRGATKLPLVPVLAGLSDAGDVLSRGGISRRAAEYDIRLGQLSEGEPAEAVRMMFDAFRVRAAEATQAKWGQGIEEISDRWPAHMKTAMTALARELLRTGGDLEQADWNRMRQEAASLRHRGYEARCSPEMEDASASLAKFFRMVDRPIRRTHAIDALRRQMEGDPNVNMPPQDFLMHLIHQGALHDPEGDRQYVCPIPSFRDFLIDKGTVPEGSAD